MLWNCGAVSNAVDWCRIVECCRALKRCRMVEWCQIFECCRLVSNWGMLSNGQMVLKSRMVEWKVCLHKQNLICMLCIRQVGLEQTHICRAHIKKYQG